MRPIAMTGIDQRRTRRLPTRSMSTKATQVKRKFVTATESDVNVGLRNPRMVKMVAEKYISEFWLMSVRCQGLGKDLAYEAT